MTYCEMHKAETYVMTEFIWNYLISYTTHLAKENIASWNKAF